MLLEQEGDVDSVEYRKGHARIYIENSAQPEFNEIVVEISADEYPAGYIPENYINFSDIVSAVVDSLTVVTSK